VCDGAKTAVITPVSLCSFSVKRINFACVAGSNNWDLSHWSRGIDECSNYPHHQSNNTLISLSPNQRSQN
jgi:hypothetical protein